MSDRVSLTFTPQWMEERKKPNGFYVTDKLSGAPNSGRVTLLTKDGEPIKGSVVVCYDGFEDWDLEERKGFDRMTLSFVLTEEYGWFLLHDEPNQMDWCTDESEHQAYIDRLNSQAEVSANKLTYCFGTSLEKYPLVPVANAINAHMWGTRSSSA
jgi:hypothetical protein